MNTNFIKVVETEIAGPRRRYQLGRLTVVSGPNRAGKTVILRSLLEEAYSTHEWADPLGPRHAVLQVDPTLAPTGRNSSVLRDAIMQRWVPSANLTPSGLLPEQQQVWDRLVAEYDVTSLDAVAASSRKLSLRLGKEWSEAVQALVTAGEQLMLAKSALVDAASATAMLQTRLDALLAQRQAPSAYAPAEEATRATDSLPPCPLCGTVPASQPPPAPVQSATDPARLKLEAEIADCQRLLQQSGRAQGRVDLLEEQYQAAAQRRRAAADQRDAGQALFKQLNKLYTSVLANTAQQLVAETNRYMPLDMRASLRIEANGAGWDIETPVAPDPIPIGSAAGSERAALLLAISLAWHARDSSPPVLLLDDESLATMDDETLPALLYILESAVERGQVAQVVLATWRDLRPLLASSTTSWVHVDPRSPL